MSYRSADPRARPWMGADYATRREPSRLREPIAHHVNIREAAPEALSTLSLPILAHPMRTGVPSPGQRDKSLICMGPAVAQVAK
jgi:hypothetical protein